MTAHADLVVFVSRNARGDLYDGVRARLEKIDGVQRVDALDIRGLRPGLNDLTVEVTTTLTVRPRDRPDAESVAAQLADGFGVKRAAATVESRDEIS